MRRDTLRPSTFILCLTAALAVQGCREDDPHPNDDAAGSTGDSGDPDAGGSETAGADETGTGGTPAMTFWDDVAPVLYESCVSCHRDGGVAPFALETYAQARDWSVAIAAAV